MNETNSIPDELGTYWVDRFGNMWCVGLDGCFYLNPDAGLQRQAPEFYAPWLLQDHAHNDIFVYLDPKTKGSK